MWRILQVLQSEATARNALPHKNWSRHANCAFEAWRGDNVHDLVLDRTASAKNHADYIAWPQRLEMGNVLSLDPGHPIAAIAAVGRRRKNKYALPQLRFAERSDSLRSVFFHALAQLRQFA